jgi:Hemerythrin HHE cation binding domain
MTAAALPHGVAPRMDAISLLCYDHARLAGLFETFDRMSGASKKTKSYLVKLICLEVRLHSLVEEQIFYPAAFAAIGDRLVLDEEQDVHAFAKHLTRELDNMTPDDPDFDAKVALLGKYLRHHGERERHEIFPKVMQAGVDLKALGSRIRFQSEELVGPRERDLAREIMLNLGLNA